MVLADVNVYVAAFRFDHPDHSAARRWLEATLASPNAFGVSELALSAVIRITTNPRAVKVLNQSSDVFEYVNAIRQAPQAVIVAPGPRHWELFERLVVDARATGPLITDAWFAALAIEHGCEWITFDGDFARFPGLKWRRPD